MNGKIHSYIELEHFYDANGNFLKPEIYIQSYSEANPLIILTSGRKFTFIFSQRYYDLLSDEQLINILSLGKKQIMFIPFWVTGKFLALKILFIQFFKSSHEQIGKIRIEFIRELFLISLLALSYLTTPIFILSGHIYSSLWNDFLKKAYKDGELIPESWHRLEQSTHIEGQMTLISYLMRTGQAELKGYSLVNIDV